MWDLQVWCIKPTSVERIIPEMREKAMRVLCRVVKNRAYSANSVSSSAMVASGSPSLPRACAAAAVSGGSVAVIWAMGFPATSSNHLDFYCALLLTRIG